MNRKIGVVLSYILMIVEMFSTLLFTPFLIRTLGQAEYGIYTLILSITSYLTLLDLGVGNSVVRFMSKYRAKNQFEEKKKFLGITTVYYAIIAFVVICIGFVFITIFPSVFAKGLSESEIATAQKLLSFTMINVAVTLGTAGFYHSIIAHERFYVSKGIPIFSIIVRVLLSILVLFSGMGSLGIVTVQLLITIVTRGFMVFYTLFKLKIIPTLKKVKFSQIKEIFCYSSIILLQMVATHINAMADQILIGMFTVSASAILAVYAIGSQLNNYTQSIGGALNGVLMPGIVNLVENGATSKTLQTEMTRIGRMNFMLVGLIWTGFAVFGQQFVVLWAGEVNRDAYFIALLLMTPFVVIITQAIGGQILWAKNKHKTQAILKFCIVTLNVALTIFLIKWNPLWGATIGTVISLIFGDIIVMQIVFHKDIGIKLKEYYYDLFKGILPALIVTGLLGILFKMINLNGWTGLFINCIVIVIVYGCCMILFGFNNYEKELFGKPIKRILNKFRLKK